MTFTQQSFLGASIRSFTGHLGWGDSASTLEVDVCEDDVIGERFNPPYPGTLVYFDYQGWEFGGLIQSFKKIRGQEGNSLYSVSLEDPRELLTGVMLIVSNYTSSIYNVPNLYNIFGYVEANGGFGAADVTSVGMPWLTVKNAFLTLQETTPLKIYDQTFYVDLTNLPTLPPFHRIAGPGISLMDFIADICNGAGCDLFFRLIYQNGRNTLKLYTISRTSNPNPDAILQFLDSLNGFHQSEIGMEFRNEVNNKFLIGGKVQKLYGQLYQYNEVDEEYIHEAGFTIYPFWGQRDDQQGVKIAEYGKYVTAYNFDDFINQTPLTDLHTYNLDDIAAGIVQRAHGTVQLGFFNKDIKKIVANNNPNGPFVFPWLTKEDQYITDYNELRAALTSQDAWLNFLFFHNTQDTVSMLTDKFKLIEFGNIHKGKYGPTGLNLISLFDDGFLTEIEDKATNFASIEGFIKNDLSMLKLQKSKIHVKDQDNIIPFDNEDKIRQLYEAVKFFAEEHFGTTFMVHMPMVAGKINRDENSQVSDWRGDLFTMPGNQIITSWEPATDGGYIDNVDYQTTNGENGSTYTPVSRSEFAKAVEQKLLPLDIKNLSDDNKIHAYARFKIENDKGVPLDFSQIPQDSYSDFNGYRYIKCEVFPQFVFLKDSTLYSPRAVIKLPGQVSINTIDLKWQAAMLKSMIMGKINLSANLNNAQKQTLQTALDDKFGGVSSDFLMEDFVPFPVMPSFVVIPLRSNVLTYGPWYSIGANGKTEFEADENIVPWNFSSYDDMNQAAQARVEQGKTTQQYGTTGSVTYPDVPQLNMGDALISNGPYLTDINVSIGQGGATTTYNFQTWTKQFGVALKEMADERRKNRNIARKQRHAIFNARKSTSIANAQEYGKNPSKPTRRIKSFSTHPVITYGKTGNSADVAMAPSYNMADQTIDSSGKAVASLDTIFAAFSTHPNSRRIPHFEAPSGSFTPIINVTGLNPFYGPHSFSVMTRSDEDWNESIVIQNSGVDKDTGVVDQYKGVGFRMPMIGVGWGYDTAGVKVGNKENIDSWKAGPIDIRWNDNNKCWVAGNAGISRGHLRSALYYNGSGLCDFYNYNVESGRSILTGSEYVFDWLLATGYYIPNGTKCILYNEGNRKYIVNASTVTTPLYIFENHRLT